MKDAPPLMQAEIEEKQHKQMKHEFGGKKKEPKIHRVALKK